MLVRGGSGGFSKILDEIASHYRKCGFREAILATAGLDFHEDLRTGSRTCYSKQLSIMRMLLHGKERKREKGEGRIKTCYVVLPPLGKNDFFANLHC